ncbi:MAG: acetylglutamate kinase [Candidatus Thermofonsia Clade 1 bacterium]|jgi:acetylglutamate kinase|uniref:Acetylglutamate kinase n=1 Tax=Candidatus Thermofonsia Clade 1 bacterium TaxID=2364210 RepID=A0A2M8PE68_9CHLR|nr:MAG: acetylglutamate kinase [Candidatus Thermofonsia Clade 1 bacterium]PJF43410.1 MAG: acetylglutamate kinase [Candidatus Thermofonsia Clade 1 bacterium]RMF52910.1 MAG: acetylglutamate kinase [Chloroflexota bacterium]
MLTVYKIGGAPLEDSAYLSALAEHLKRLATPPILVHGGGKAINRLQAAFGITPRSIGGLRVTDEQTMALVAMALIGEANVNLVATLVKHGVEAQGFHGADRALLRSRRLEHPEGDLGRVGAVHSVRVEVLEQARSMGVVPVIAPIALADDGGLHNINADQAAGAIAAAIGAAQVIFLTDVPGVLHEGAILPQLSRHQAESLIADGTAQGGMAVKVRAALEALSAGVGAARITDIYSLSNGTGTLITA